MSTQSRSRRREARKERFHRDYVAPRVRFYLLEVTGAGRFTGPFEAIYEALVRHCGRHAMVKTTNKGYEIFGSRKAWLTRL
jgi:hypothetical protein